jgi:hypothetical protein
VAVASRPAPRGSRLGSISTITLISIVVAVVDVIVGLVQPLKSRDG